MSALHPSIGEGSSFICAVKVDYLTRRVIDERATYICKPSYNCFDSASNRHSHWETSLKHLVFRPGCRRFGSFRAARAQASSPCPLVERFITTAPRLIWRQAYFAAALLPCVEVFADLFVRNVTRCNRARGAPQVLLR
jgi:hypothetical protein